MLRCLSAKLGHHRAANHSSFAPCLHLQSHVPVPFQRGASTQLGLKAHEAQPHATRGTVNDDEALDKSLVKFLAYHATGDRTKGILSTQEHPLKGAESFEAAAGAPGIGTSHFLLQAGQDDPKQLQDLVNLSDSSDRLSVWRSDTDTPDGSTKTRNLCNDSSDLVAWSPFSKHGSSYVTKSAFISSYNQQNSRRDLEPSLPEPALNNSSGQEDSNDSSDLVAWSPFSKPESSYTTESANVSSYTQQNSRRDTEPSLLKPVLDDSSDQEDSNDSSDLVAWSPFSKPESSYMTESEFISSYIQQNSRRDPEPSLPESVLDDSSGQEDDTTHHFKDYFTKHLTLNSTKHLERYSTKHLEISSTRHLEISSTRHLKVRRNAAAKEFSIGIHDQKNEGLQNDRSRVNGSRCATSRLPSQTLWTGKLIKKEDYKRKGIMRSLCNEAGRLSARQSCIPVNPELIENEISRRRSSLYSYSEFYKWWNQRLYGLVVSHDNRGPSRETAMFRKYKKGAQWIMGCLLSEDFSLSVSSGWIKLTHKQKQRMWPSAMLHCLMTSAQASVSFLQATLPVSYPSFIMLADTLWTVRHLRKEELESNEQLKAAFVLLLQHLFDVKSWPWKGLQERYLGLILEFATHEQTCNTFYRIVKKRLRYYRSDMLRFMDKFTAFGDIDNALEALYFYARRMRDSALEEEPLMTPDVLKRCTDLLMLDSVTKTGNTQNFRILPAMLKVGVVPDQVLYNVLIDNALKNDVPEVGWDVYHFMKENGLPLDSYTYVALLKYGIRYEDTVKIAEILNEVLSHNDLQVSDELLSYVLHVIRKLQWLRNRQGGPSSSYPILLGIYRRHRHILPLHKLGIVKDLDTRQAPLPSRETLGVLVNAFLFARVSPDTVWTIYKRFRALVHDSDPHISVLAESDHVYNAFVSCLAQTKTYLPRCITVVQDMLNSPRDSLVKPSSRTYHLLVTACVRWGKIEAAEKVIQIMIKHGLETKGTLHHEMAIGYAKAGRWEESDLMRDRTDPSETAFWNWEGGHSFKGGLSPDFAELLMKLEYQHAPKSPPQITEWKQLDIEN